MAQIATISKEAETALKKFRNNSPPVWLKLGLQICYIDRKSGSPVVKLGDNLFDDDEDFSVTELASRLPNAPRYIVMNHTPKGKPFSKVIFINWIPDGCETAASMLHVGTMPEIEKLARFPKVLEVNDEEGLTPELIDAKLGR